MSENIFPIKHCGKKLKTQINGKILCVHGWKTVLLNIVQPLWKTVWSFLKKLKIELLYDPAIPLLSIYPKEMKTGYGRDICTPTFIVALSTIAKIRKEPKCPSTDEWIKKL